ncbi:MAG TPA: cytochrome c-type biogenesis protein CcmH [Bryobacteraceae bacterium]|nr:cytochrome c-type biogenesis protein CcmH [Bryobacteraceae bacterium]
MIRRCILLLTLSVLLGAVASPADQNARIASLERTFLAPCCWSEPISTHRSEVALQMRAEIVRWVAEGRSDREIIDAYRQRYGARVLVEPEGSQWWWMSVIPWVALLLGLALTVLVVRRMSARKTPPAPAAGPNLPPDQDWDT